ncbi:oocyte zinc finger protein XlCOF6-like isoform X2 [Phyllopteryx taeniolatus]|uniref:oocyte zinc finger protein XlCOF6-like isoform X2 n=1 Tax=Phyllopteryx taeniolatus TaxID=161469 RepID=UPI002AD38B9A|nr:oocyte zinc finger protein XlCOF6-like isoform X2 [Phyllopteryx taeniolatus]
MLKELVRERLIAAADEIFGLFERTIASYEEQLGRAREETERHRRQLESVGVTRIVVHVKDLQQQSGGSSLEQEHPQPLHLKEEEEHPQPLHLKEDVKDPQDVHIKEEEEKAEVTEFPLTCVSVGSKNYEDEPCEPSELHHHSLSGDQCGRPPPENLLAPLSDGDATEESLRRNDDYEGDNGQSQCSEMETTPGRKETSQTCNRRFSCPACGKKFVSNSALIIHIRIHTGEKPFGCSVCGKGFTCKVGFVTHMRTHSGEKPFSCPVCHKTFSRKDHMGTHLKTHTREKPFCSVCGGKFPHKSSLNMHMCAHDTERKKVLLQ